MQPQSNPTPNPDFNYGRYLASREWALLKNAVRERSGGLCERCHNAPAVEVHHQSYERTGHELLEDLQHVCRACHLFESAKSTASPIIAPLNEREWREFINAPLGKLLGFEGGE